MAYCTINDIKARMLIESIDTQYDSALNNAANEATEIINMFLKPYTTVPLVNPTGMIVEITADFGASVFKRRYLPNEVRLRGPPILEGVDSTTQAEAEGWFGLAKSKLEFYIRNTYVLAQNLASIYNPEIFLEMLRRGIITGKEARAFINNATVLYTKKIDQLTVITVKNDTIIIDKNDTVSTYSTKRQKSFGFISGGEPITGEQNPSGYQKDSESESE